MGVNTSQNPEFHGNHGRQKDSSSVGDPLLDTQDTRSYASHLISSPAPHIILPPAGAQHPPLVQTPPGPQQPHPQTSPPPQLLPVWFWSWALWGRRLSQGSWRRLWRSS